MLDPASLLGGVASNLLYDVLKLAAFALRDQVAGPAEMRALRAAYQDALRNETEPTVRMLLTAEGVAGRLLAPALVGDLPDFGQHRALLTRTIPRATVPAGFDDAMARFCSCKCGRRCATTTGKEHSGAGICASDRCSHRRAGHD